MNNIDANDLLLFAQVIDCGNLTRAAEHTGLPKSTLSRRMQLLEQQLGGKLMQRGARGLTITEFGLGILEYANKIQQETQAADLYAQQRQSTPSGRLKISVPPEFLEVAPPQFLQQFSRDHPLVELDVDLSHRDVNVIADGFDLLIRMSIMGLPSDTSLIASRVCDLPRGLYASPDYLRAAGAPSDPEDLWRHASLQMRTAHGETVPWDLKRGKNTWAGRPHRPLTANTIGPLRLLAIQGYGIVMLSHKLAQPMLDNGSLIRVLPEWSASPATMWALTACKRKLLAMKTKAFLDALVAAVN